MLTVCHCERHGGSTIRIISAINRRGQRDGSIGAIEMNGKDEIMEMPAEVDFSNSVPNPYIGKARRRVTMNIDG